jgi:hypothetical protein
MCPAIDNPASCEIRTVISFPHVKNMGAAEIHRELCAAVCGQNVMSEGTARKWCRVFKDERANVRDEERSCRPTVVSDDLVQSVDQQICEKGLSQFQNVRVNFHKFHVIFSTRLSELA